MLKKVLLFVVFFLGYLFINPQLINSTDVSELNSKILEYEKKLSELAKAKDTLANQIKIIDSQVSLTLLKINQTELSISNLENDIGILSVKIDQLDKNLNELSLAYIHETNQNYKLDKRVPAFAYLLTANFNKYWEQQKYINAVQIKRHNSLINMETTRTNFDIQKDQKTKKQAELEVLKKTLASQQTNLNKQKSAKNNLLETTKNDEKKYQELLNQTRSELAAIDAIIAGNGTETKMNDVSEGNKIASIIVGSSCSSSGTHLHFMVKTKDNTVQNPLNYLKSVNYQDNSNGDSFNPTGSWDWPIKTPVQFNQGYGNTWSVRHTWVGRVYQFHNGIDVSSNSSNDVYATNKGTLYQGVYYVKSQKCYLRYVRVETKDTGISTLYLHVNY